MKSKRLFSHGKPMLFGEVGNPPFLELTQGIHNKMERSFRYVEDQLNGYLQQGKPDNH